MLYSNDIFVTSDLPVIFTNDDVTSEQKIVIHDNEYIISFLTRYFMSWTYNSANNTIDCSFRHCRKERSNWLSIVKSPHLICDNTRTRGTSIVSSYSSIVLARANWSKCDLH